MSSNVTKRTLSAGLGVGALALLAPRASADTPFSSFAFRATGAPTARTLPDRFGDLKNVKDFGAVGDGATDDTAAVQAAVNAVSRGGRLLLPGVFNISSPILIGGNFFWINLMGPGVLNWVGTRPGNILVRAPDGTGDGGTLIIDQMTFWNRGIYQGGANNACIRFINAERLTIRDCKFEARACIRIEHMGGGGGIHASTIHRCHFRGVQGDDGAGTDSFALQVSGYAICDIDGVDINGFNKGIHIVDGTAWVKNLRVEMVNHGVHVESAGCALENCQHEANFINHVWCESGGVSIKSASMLADGWENSPNWPAVNVGITDGIRLGGGVSVHLENIVVSGYYSSSAIRFERGNPPRRSIFMRVLTDVASGSTGVGWKNFAANGNTFIQCNNP
jgi:hypothetical protein